MGRDDGATRASIQRRAIAGEGARVRLWPDRQETREQLARLEKILTHLEKGVEDHGRALGTQQVSVATLGERLTAVERQLSGLGAQQEAHFVDVGTSVGAVGSGIGESLDKVRRLLKGLRRSDKGLTQDIRKLLGRLAQLGRAFDASVDGRFLELAQPLVKSKRTMLGYDRLFTLWQAAGNTVHLNLPAAEVGTFRGGSAALLAAALRTFAGSERELHVVDTFEGHLDSTFSEHDPELQRGKFRQVSYEDVREYLAAFPNLLVHKGDAASVIKRWPERRYSLIHLDVDLYRPTLECLEYFGPRLAEGGIIVMDDYEAPTCPGVSRATHEYLAGTPAFQTWRLQAEQVVLVKRGQIS
jgi:O-methyltransferase